ncbi:MAG TPA: GDP-mannose 4,6-dehydratase [Anaerolineales bacterium]|nr:GDP-mannose 4,6-dehydratase [Anaerolineales bacterium]
MMPDISSKTILVTGAGGFIGSHLVETLFNLGVNIRAFVRYNSRSDIGLLSRLPQSILTNIEIQAGDLQDPDAVRKAVKGCDLVFHLGALISIPYSYRHPVEVAQVNFNGTLNILQACLDLNVGRLVHTSTSEVYGTARTVPMNEMHPLQGQSPYSASKIGADKLAEAYFCSYDLPVVTVRPFNTYGPRQSYRAVIPTIISQALFQNQVNLGNLDAVRDFTFITDTVNGFICAAQSKEALGNTYNLGTGDEIRIGDLADKIIKLVNRAVTIHVDHDRLRPDKSEVGRLLSDNSLAQQQLKWTPQVSLDDGLSRTITWFRENINENQVGKFEV